MVSTWRRLGVEAFRILLYCFCNDYYFYLLLPTILLEPRCASNGVRGFVTTGQSYLALSLLRNYEMRPYSLSRFYYRIHFWLFLSTQSSPNDLSFLYLQVAAFRQYRSQRHSKPQEGSSSRFFSEGMRGICTD
jgi:hypothetical protein